MKNRSSLAGALCAGMSIGLATSASGRDGLVVSRPMALAIKAPAKHIYVADLNTGDRASLSVTESGPIDIATFAPDGRLLSRPQEANGGEVDFVIAAETAGNYRIELTSPRAPARYAIELDGI